MAASSPEASLSQNSATVLSSLSSTLVTVPVVDKTVVRIVVSGEIGQTLDVEHNAVACHDVFLLLSIQSVLLFQALNLIFF